MFWKELNRLSGCKVSLSSAYHPQSDGQKEIVNKTIEHYLRSTIHDKPRRWLEILPFAELWYSSSYQSAIAMSLFKMLYGREPPDVPEYIPLLSKIQAVDQELTRREEFKQTVKKNLEKAQKKMKNAADKKRTPITYEEGDLVLVRLQPYKQTSIKAGFYHKLGQKYYRPFLILQKINEVTITV